GIFSTYNGNLFLATEPGGNLNSNPGDHSALMITGTSQNIGIGNVSPSSKLHITTSGGSTTAPNVVLTVQADTSSTITTGGGTAIKFKGVSSGGNIQNYDQAMIASLGQATNNGHGLDFYVKPNAATELTKAVTITSGKVLNAVGGYQQNGTTVIDGSSGHLASDGSASVPSYRFSSDTDTGLFRAGSGQVSVSANGVHRMTFRNYGIDMTMNSSGYVDLHRSGGITFYGDESAHHSIRSRDMAGYASADLRINSYRGIFFNLDSNNNDTSGANLIVGRHGGTSSTISGLFKVDGENGNVTAEGTITASTTVSDIRRKENVEIIPDALEKVKQLDGITFNFIGDDTPMTGLIAQQVQEVLPSAVYETELLNGEKTLALHYGNTVGLLVESIKTLEAQVSALTKTIEEMQNGSDKDK
ncbi:MAG: tail fiber domain-containing protein, partial [Acidimicrobiales bacterium]